MRRLTRFLTDARAGTSSCNRRSRPRRMAQRRCPSPACRRRACSRPGRVWRSSSSQACRRLVRWCATFHDALLTPAGHDRFRSARHPKRRGRPTAAAVLGRHRRRSGRGDDGLLDLRQEVGRLVQRRDLARRPRSHRFRSFRRTPLDIGSVIVGPTLRSFAPPLLALRRSPQPATQ